jgi:hypothetical protein
MELNECVWKSDPGNLIKMQILSQGKYQNAEISNLIDKSKVSQEINYISLIYLYSKNNETDKVETARKWKQQYPLLNGRSKSI